MNKVLIITAALCSIFSLVYSQSKTQLGITVEGLAFMPTTTSAYSPPNKNGLGSGIGVYASRTISKHFSANIGLAYRYKEMQQHYVFYSGDGSYSPENKVQGWDNLPLHSVVVPIHVQLLLPKSFFVRAGIESDWLINYKIVNDKPEFNWTMGIGSAKYKLNWSLNYIHGFKDQGFGNKTLEADGHFKGSIYRNNMFQLSLSYPIWQIK